MNEPPQLPKPPPPKTSGMAIGSLVLGILGLFCFSILAGIPAVILGHMALGRIKRAGALLKGGGLAIGGLVTGYLSIALLPLIAIFAALAIPNFVKARNFAWTAVCVNNLQQIEAAKKTWAEEKKAGDAQTPTEQELKPYVKSSGMDPFVCPAGGTYSINALDQKPTCSFPGHRLPE